MTPGYLWDTNPIPVSSTGPEPDMTSPNPKRRGVSSFYFSLGFLLCLLTALGLFFVPRSWNSIWMDREFSCWVAPVANRISPASKLYADGLHMPMPPLPYVAMHLLGGGKADWIMESGANFIFQAATLLVLFAAFYRFMGLDVACASILVTIPFFFSLPKAIVYDSMTQFFTACAGSLAVVLLMRMRSQGVGSTGLPGGLRLLSLGVGAITGVVFLCKQSTAAGLVLGLVLAVATFPSNRSFRERFSFLTLIGCSTVATIGLLSFCLSPWINVGGFYYDVLIIGSEPKGGGIRLFYYLCLFVMTIGATVFCVIAPVLLSYVGYRPFREWLRKHHGQLDLQPRPAPTFHVMAMLGSVVGLGTVFVLARQGSVLSSYLWFPEKISDVVALTAGCIAILFMVWASGSKFKSSIAHYPGTAFVAIFLPAALFHNLSANYLRWHYDNNPLIAACFAVFFWLLFSILKLHLQGYWHMSIARAAVFFLIGALCMPMFDQFRDASLCTEPWPEITYLAGVSMRPGAEGIRQIVQFAESATARDDQILVLPDDPNFRAFFDRPAPHLSCAVIFPDQYWDRYVDSDYARLKANPPRMIIIGPRIYWRPFFWIFHKNQGAERLIDKVVDDLLPQRYTLVHRQEIFYRSKIDYLDAYLRRDDIPPGASSN